jgi:hypothetical protein
VEGSGSSGGGAPGGTEATKHLNRQKRENTEGKRGDLSPSNFAEAFTELLARETLVLSVYFLSVRRLSAPAGDNLTCGCCRLPLQACGRLFRRSHDMWDSHRMASSWPD